MRMRMYFNDSWDTDSEQLRKDMNTGRRFD